MGIDPVFQSKFHECTKTSASLTSTVHREFEKLTKMWQIFPMLHLFSKQNFTNAQKRAQL